MSYLVLARKWRPQIFEEVIGQRHVTKTLQNAIISDRVAHAFLFTGTRGVGKTSVARILAKALNCNEGPTAKPCNQCQACGDISAGVSLDVLEIDGASNTGVDDVRQLRENVGYLPSKGRHKVFIIDEVHMLSNSAFNALLKTLEEPPKHVVFIFATTEPHKIPSTILSRCQRYDFKRIPVRDILAQLKLVVSEENIQISDESLGLIARKAEGSMRDAQSILDQAISFAGNCISDDEMVEILGIIDRNLLYETSLSVIERNPRRCLDIIEDTYNYGYDIKEFYKDLLEHFRNLIVAKVAECPSKLIDLPEADIEKLIGQGASTGVDEMERLFRILATSEEEITKSTNPKLMMEMTLVRMAHTRPLRSVDDILAKISALEARLRDSQDNGAPADIIPLKRPQSFSPHTSRARSTEDEGMGVSYNRGCVDEELGIKELDTKGRWPNLIGYIKKKKPLLASMLELGQLLHLDDEKVEIGFQESSVFLDSVNEKQNRKDLTELCRDFLQMDVAVCVSPMVSNSDSAPIAENVSNGYDRIRKLRHEALNNSIIQDAISIFGGKITEIRTEHV